MADGDKLTTGNVDNDVVAYLDAIKRYPALKEAALRHT